MPDKILFIDAECVMCHGTAQLVARHDDAKRIFFAALNGKTAQEAVEQSLIDPEIDSVFYVRGWGTEEAKGFSKLDAILAICRDLGGLFRLLLIFDVLPLGMKSRLYDFVAKRRYRLFGKKDQCDLGQVAALQKRSLS